LWTEYEYGVDGHKAAKDFTAKERGRNKENYDRRKIVWDVITSLIRCNYTVASAIDLIQQCYGRKTSVTKVMAAMVRDKSTGGHPNLNL
jgi:hypothetical protein